MLQSTRRQPFSWSWKETEGHELKAVSKRYDDDRDSHVSRGGETELVEDHSGVPVRSDILVSNFPDYVLEMTEETQRNDSKLATEYQVSL